MLKIYFSVIVLFAITAFASLQAQNFESSNLPIVVINTQGQIIVDDPKVNVQMGIIDNGVGNRNYYKNPLNNNLPDPFNGYEGTIGIEFRGSSSQSFPKKPYGFETREPNSTTSKKVSLLGMPSESDWILNATYNDKSLMRDVLTYQLSNQTGMYASRTKYVELVIDGEYQGIYILMEKIKRDGSRVNISSIKSTDNSGDALTGGYILKIDKSTGTPGGIWRSPYDPVPDRALFIQIEYPKLSNLSNEQFEYIKNHVTAFETNLKSNDFKDPTNGYAKYIDVNTFVDYFLISEITHNPDAYRLSTFFFKDKDSKNTKLKMGPPWDYNHAFGNANYCNGWESNSWVYTTNKQYCLDDGSHVPFWWERLLEDREFCLKLKNRWQELRQTEWTYQHIETSINQNVTLLEEAQARNFERWPVLGQYIWPNYQWGATYSEEIVLLKDWIQARLAWMDANLPTIGALKCDGVSMPSVTTPISYCQGQSSTPLSAVGTNLKWYATQTDMNGSVTPPTPPTSEIGTINYFVSQTINGCESERAKIEVNVNIKPSAPTASNVEYCQGQAAVPLSANGADLKWYSTPFDGEGSNSAPTPPTTSANLISYFVSQTVNKCESNRTQINVNVKNKPNPPQVTSTQTYCQGQAINPLSASGTSLLWYNAFTGGQGSPTPPTPSTASSGLFLFYVSQTVNDCESDRAKIEVNVNVKPSAPVVSNVVYTQGQPTAPLSATGLFLKWYSSITGGQGSTVAPTPSSSSIGTTSYFVSQTTNNCESERAKIEVQVTAPVSSTICMDIKVFLEGAMNGTTMHNRLYQQGLLPGATPLSALSIKTPAGQPYKGSPWNYNGVETVSSYANDVVDWVLISLRTAPQEPSTTVFRTAALLHQDGKITTLTACPTLSPSQSYFVVVEHRNHIGVVSHDAIPVSNGKISYDFTQRQSYIPPGLPASGQLQVGTIFCLFASDCNKASFSEINANDASVWLQDNGKFGLYKASDFNLDGEVNANDASIWRRNNGKFSGVQF